MTATASAPGFRTRGQPAAVDAASAMLRHGLPHAVLVAGPAGVGKRTFAEDIAAALLCRHDDPEARPCRVCRGCRAFEHGNHPDVHRLRPTGAGAVIPIGGRDERGVRDLVRDLSLLPVEGGARVAIITSADRMTEDAQSAFLKTLEEPPAGAILLLTAADEERLLPTIRSRCVRVRLGSVPRADVEAIVIDAGLADAPAAARVARLVGGRPGEAIALARAPASLTIRAEIARTLLDLLAATRTDRLRVGRDLLARAAAFGAAIQAAAGVDAAAVPPGARGRVTRGRGKAGAATTASAPAASVTAVSTAPEAGSDAPAGVEPSGEAAAQGAGANRVPAAERRAAALLLIGIWRDVARDLSLVRLGQASAIRQVELLDDLEAAAARVPDGFAVEQLRRLELAGERLEGNVSPELVLDALVIGWGAPAVGRTTPARTAR